MINEKYPVQIHENMFHKPCTTTEKKDGSWRLARPLAYPTFKQRFRLAWGVFIGKYDALEWENDQ